MVAAETTCPLCPAIAQILRCPTLYARHLGQDPPADCRSGLPTSAIPFGHVNDLKESRSDRRLTEVLGQIRNLGPELLLT